MADRRLNLNTPLMSVRRNLSSVASLSSLKARAVEDSRPKIGNGNRSMDQVTEAVSVPFTWEQVPGRAKDDLEHEHELLLSDETLSAAPAFAARNSTTVHDDCSEKEFREIIQTDKASMTDEDDVYSDAVDMLSPAGSISVCYSVSGLSGSDGPVVKRSGTFSADSRTQDFMMGRFLPAARAIAMASESSLHCTSENQHLLLTEEPDEAEKPQVSSAVESRTPSRQQNMEIVQYFTQALPQEESSEEEEVVEVAAAAANDDHSRYNSMPTKGCGLLPQLRIRSSFRLLNPVPGLKSRIRNSMPFVPAIRKEPKDESKGRSVESFHLPVLRVQSVGPPQKSQGNQIKPEGGSSRLNFSGDLRKLGRLSPFRSRRNDTPASEKSEPPHNAHVVPPLRGSRPVNLSGELRPMSRSSSPFRFSRNDNSILERNESPRTSHVVPPFRGSVRANFSGELRSVGGLSPFRPPRNDVASSQVNLSGDLRTTGRLSPFRASRNDAATSVLSQTSYVVPTLGALNRRNFSGELRTSGQLSPFRREVFQPSYVVPPVGWSSRHNLSGELQTASQLSPFRREVCQPSYVVPLAGWSSRHNFSGELQTQRRPSPVRPQRNQSMQPVSPALERTLHADKVITARKSCSDSNSSNCKAWKDPVAEEIAAREVECLKVVIREENSKVAENRTLDPPLPIPSLRSPSQSWLWSTLPSSGAARSRHPSPQKTPLLSSTKQDPDKCRAGAKWETIVKTSKTYHDHTRYSEELVERVSRQCKS